MKIIDVQSKEDKKRYIDFVYKLYRKDENFCDMNLLFVKNYLFKKDDHAKRSMVLPIIIEEGDIKLVGMFISTNDSPQIKLSFLEFLPNSQVYIKELVDYGKKLMVSLDKQEIIVGINGHVSYGLGILAPNSNRDFEFNSNYNKEYYTRELEEVMPVTKKAFSYQYTVNHSLSLIKEGIIERVEKEYTYRCLNKKHFKREMLIFGNLADQALRQTPYYSEKTPLEMYQLMKKMRFIMKKEDIVFAMKDGKEVGFIFTHPDYAKLFDRPKVNYIKFYLRFLRKRTHHLIYNVIGILPEYQKTGLGIGLIHYTIRLRQKEYTQGVSSFILEDNFLSTKMCKGLSIGDHKEYRIYEIKRENNV